MGLEKYFNAMLAQQSMETNVAFIGKVVFVTPDLGAAEIQPLGLLQQQNEAARPQANVGGVPIIESAKYKIRASTLRYVSGVSGGGSTSARTEYSEIEILTREAIAAGDLVICVCCDRDIRQALKGVNALPEPGSHSINSAVIVGILEAKA